MREINIECVCGVRSMVLMVGDNNADGKSLCSCGRHITVHLRKSATLSRGRECRKCRRECKRVVAIEACVLNNHCDFIAMEQVNSYSL